jgi:energy-coupling factor transport system permease protein
MWNRDTGTHEFHIGAWSLWLCAAMLAALGTRNPFYLALVLVVAVLVGWTVDGGRRTEGEGGNYELRITNYEGEGHSRRGNSQTAIGGLWRIVVIVTLVVAVFKGLSNHYGETVMFSLPDWLPPPFAGPITVEGMSSAGLDALTLMTVLAVFGAFSAGADYYALLRSVPSAMHGAALVTSIGITFVPQTIQRWSEIREAQALRGHKVRRIADLLPLVIPLLAGGMERSMNLAEAMEARGFSRATARARGMSPLLVQVGLVGGLGLLLTGGTMFAFVPGTPLLGWLLIGVGLSLIALTLRGMSRGIKRTRYRRSVWRGHDTPLAIVSGGVLGILIVFKFIAPSLLAYTPFLRISMPDFDPVVALTLCALAAPAAIIRLQRSRMARNTVMKDL